MKTSLEQLIKQYIALPARTNATGWFPVLCKVCNDHGKKGPRGGFKFDNGTVGYHCFNCGHKALFDPSSQHGNKISNNMQQVLSAFGVPESEWKKVYLDLLSTDAQEYSQRVRSYDIQPIAMPEYFVPLATSTDEMAEHIKYYLKEQRGIDYQQYPFYHSVPSDVPHSNKWLGRVIIPLYKHRELIFYIGRDITGERSKKYESPSIAKNNILGNFDQLFVNLDQPLYVVEGWFDSFHINGVCVMKNSLTEGQIHWLSQSRREKVIIPDRFKSGKPLGDQALDLGWSVSTPDIGDCKDINEAVVQYGLLYVTKTIRENTHKGNIAKVKLQTYCR